MHQNFWQGLSGTEESLGRLLLSSNILCISFISLPVLKIFFFPGNMLVYSIKLFPFFGKFISRTHMDVNFMNKYFLNSLQNLIVMNGLFAVSAF